MRVSIVVAAAENGTIGAAGGIPWRLPDDQRRFKALTTGHCIIMGRKTHESIGRLLPGRTTLIVSSNPDYRVEGAFVHAGLDEALAAARARDESETFIVGGERLYRLALSRADRIYLTRVHADVDGDVFFPDAKALAEEGFRRGDTEIHAADDRHALAFTFEDWERRR